MNIRVIALTLFILSFSQSALSAEPTLHPEVQFAVDYLLPEKTCKKPRQRNDSRFAIQEFEEDQREYLQCDADYASQLKEDFDALFSSAQHGLTQTQAKRILTKIKLIQDTLETEYEQRTAYLNRFAGGRQSLEDSISTSVPGMRH